MKQQGQKKAAVVKIIWGLIGLKLLPAQRFQNGMTGCLFSGMRDFTVIMGSSGAGKSTLLYALSGMDKIPDG